MMIYYTKIQTSVLHTVTALLPLFLLGQLSLFSPLSMMYISIYLACIYCSYPNNAKKIRLKNHLPFLRFFASTSLMTLHPAFFYATVLSTHTRNILNYSDRNFIVKHTPSIEAFSSYPVKELVLLFYYFSLDTLIMLLIQPYIPLPAIEFSKNHLPLCLIANKLSLNPSNIMGAAYDNIIDMLDSSSSKEKRLYVN